MAKSVSMISKSITQLSTCFLLCLSFLLVSCNGDSVEPKKDFVITFDTKGGGNIPSITVPEGGVATKPATPIKDNSNFYDWFIDDDVTPAKFDFDTPITNDITIYARWAVGGSIVDNKFIYDRTSEHVIVPHGVKEITYLNFDGTNKLKTISLPNSIKSIGAYAFLNSSLTSITIPTSVTSIGDHAFYRCSGLTSISIPNSVAHVGDYAFAVCSGLTSITIPSSITSIGSYTFSNCTRLTNIAIPNSVTSIGDAAFLDSGLTSITIPASVTSIGMATFSGCNSLTSVTIPNSVISIESNVFLSCSNLTSITIPNSVTSIGMAAFGNCRNLQSVTLLRAATQGVTTLGEYVFDGTHAQLSITVPTGSGTAYKAASTWEDYAAKIVEAGN